VGLGHDTSFAISIAFNFAIIAFLFYLLVKSKVLQLFRDRTVTIQKGIREAQAASAEATQRLGNIEARLAKLDTEVAEIRSSAEREAAAEEQRILQAAEEDKRKILESVETEVGAIARNARRELKTYAATLAVELAARKIKVDDTTDQALLREFVGQLGKDGK
jgi:F-type H+-transporting ATPase subunit b